MNNPPSPLLQEACQILKKSEEGVIACTYSHQNKIQGNLFSCNCYGFINYIVNKTSPIAYRILLDLMEKMQHRIPLSVDETPCPFNYAYIFQSLSQQKCSHWSLVEKVEDALPGDILIYLPLHYEPPRFRPLEEGSTGTHIMLIEKIERMPNGTIHLSVIDCTKFPHSKREDSRAKNGGALGRSSVYLSRDGQTVYLQWQKGGILIPKQIFIGRYTGQSGPEKFFL